MGKKSRLLISLLVMAAVVAGYIYLYNWDYFHYGADSGTDYTASLEYINWQDGQAGKESGVDPQIIMQGIDGWVDYVDLVGDVSGDLSVTAYYTVTEYAAFTEDTAFQPVYNYDGHVLHINIGKQLSGLRIDLTEQSGLTVTVQSCTVYPLSLRINPLHVMGCIMLAVLLLSPLYVSKKSLRDIPVIISGFRRYTYLLWNLVRRDITTKYRRSILGLMWSILNPLLMMLIITAVFQHLFRYEVENFPIYYLTGSLIFNFVSDSTNNALMSILASSALIRKVYIPKYIFPLEKCIFAFVNMLFSFVAVLIMLAILGVGYHWTLLLAWIPMLYVFIFCVGFGMILAALNVFFRDVGHLYSVWVTAWMYLTPVIYPMNILPRAVQAVVKCNPLTYFIDCFRQLVMYGTLPSLSTNVICLAFALSFLFIGLVVFKRTQDRFILHI